MNERWAQKNEEADAVTAELHQILANEERLAKEIKAAEDPKLKKRLEAELLRVQEEAKKAWAAVHEKRDEARKADGTYPC